VPDVAGNADPRTGYVTLVDGQSGVFGGTSAVAPLWAGLTALLNQRSGVPLGFLNTQLYAQTTSLNDITVGNNGAYSAGPGWDACTGLGSPNGTLLAASLSAVPSAPPA
jgi:kumamolisin